MCFLQVPPSYCVKGRFIFLFCLFFCSCFSPASVLSNGSPLFFEASVSVLRLRGNSSLVYIMLCNVFSVSFLSVLHQTIFLKRKNNKLHFHFICRLEKNIIYVAHFIFPNFIYFILLCTVL